MSIRENILNASSQHIQLTNQISPIASAPQHLIKNTDLIHTISGKLTSRRNILKSLGIASERLYQEYKSHESSFGKRLMLKTGGENGSRSKKMQESQRKWEQARIKEQEEQELISRLESQLVEAQTLDERLRYQKSEFERLSGQLDQLNESLFGQKSEFPTQDAALSAVKVLETLSGLLQAEMAREKRAREKIIKAIPSLEFATKDLQKALNISVDAGVPTNQKYTKQVFKGSGANYTSKGAAPLLLNAKTHSGRCHTLWAEARGSQHLVKAMLPMEIIETFKLPGKGSPQAVDERGLHASLEKSYGQARANISHTKGELSSSRSRTQFFTLRSQLLDKELLEARRSLMRVRSLIVEDISRGGDGKFIRGDFGKGISIGVNEKDGDTEMEKGIALDKEEIKLKALNALREIMKQVQNEDESIFEELPGYNYWPGT